MAKVWVLEEHHRVFNQSSCIHMAKTASKSQAIERALIVGVSKYPPPTTPLPAVANDVREMTRLLTSQHGAFRKDAVATLVDNSATRDAIVAGLTDVFSKASTDKTVFVYLAGHGMMSGSGFFFVPYGADVSDPQNSCVPLTTIKSLFDNCRSRQVFLCMDFCHSGGILARGAQDDALTTLRRALKVVQGEGKIILAACTASQSAFESSAVGHGLFTHALLQGLKGQAQSKQGEVTASSLYDFIDRQVANGDQRPVFSGEMTGRIVLMHFDDRKPGKTSQSPAKTRRVTPKKSGSNRKGSHVMLGDCFFVADRVTQHPDGRISIEVTPRSGEQTANVAAMRPDRFAGRTPLPFAVGNEAFEVQVEEVASEYRGSKQTFSLTLRGIPPQTGFAQEMNINGVPPDEIARLRAGRILLNDPPPTTVRGFGRDTLLESSISGGIGRYQANDCVVQEMFRKHAKVRAWKEMARLKAVFMLKITDTVEHIMELGLGTVRANRIKISFKGRRAKRYSNEEPAVLQIAGECVLTGGN